MQLRHPALEEVVRARIDALQAADPTTRSIVWQQSRGWSEAEIESLVEKYTDDRQFGILGEPRVNVLPLNMALDGIQ